MENPLVSRNNIKINKQAGFSLLESLAVIGVASALMLAGMASYQIKKARAGCGRFY
jgi:prepilin-type N-terminal cleavage/methylation domain-containing protein